VCDTICVRDDGRTLFAKNSDRPIGEVQLVEWHPRRSAVGAASRELRTQYLTIDDADAFAVLGSRPAWLWGLEHGVNEHRVAIGNERVFTVDDAAAAPPALIGMDLVRLGLERARTADVAVDVITSLLERHGQGGIADAANHEAYFSSFLIADPTSGWVLETSGRTWAAKPVVDGAAISNRIALGSDWTRASADVPFGRSFDEWRDPKSWVDLADIRLQCTLPAASGTDAVHEPADLVALMRHHGERPWGRPGDDPADVSALPPERVGPNAEGFSVCMHLRGYQTTAASMICQLSEDPAEPLRAWVAVGSPCVSVFVPVFPGVAVPEALAAETTWRRFDALRQRVEARPSALAEVRGVLAPIEAALWARADEVGDRPDEQVRAVLDGWPSVEAGLAELGVPD
jgi:secernin